MIEDPTRTDHHIGIGTPDAVQVNVNNLVELITVIETEIGIGEVDREKVDIEDKDQEVVKAKRKIPVKALREIAAAAPKEIIPKLNKPFTSSFVTHHCFVEVLDK